MKGTLGFGVHPIKCFFRELDRFFIEEGITDVYLTKEHVMKWHSTRINDCKNTLYKKYSTLRQFCKYLNYLGRSCYIPKLPKNIKSDFIPFIFTHEQMQHIFETSDKLVITKRHSKSCVIFAIPVLLRFLYSTGVRVNEALSIRNEDVDFAHCRIVINKTKNQRQRLIPINPSLLEVLKQYEEYRNEMPVQGVSAPDRFFFVSPTGKSFITDYVLRWFRVILQDCNILNSHAIRIHDIRHTCAVHSLVKMVNVGVDIYCALPILSVFLGHKTVKGTENYVRLTREMYPAIVEMEQSITSHIYPKINPEIKTQYDNN